MKTFLLAANECKHAVGISGSATKEFQDSNGIFLNKIVISGKSFNL